MKYISETIKTFPLIHYKNFFRKAGFIWVDSLPVDKQIEAMTDAALPIEFPKVLETIEFFQKILSVFEIVLADPTDERVAHRAPEEWTEKFSKRLVKKHLTRANVRDTIDGLAGLTDYVENRMKEHPIPANVQLPIEEEGEEFSDVYESEVSTFNLEDPQDLLGEDGCGEESYEVLFSDLTDESDIVADVTRRDFAKAKAVAKVKAKKVEALPEAEIMTELFVEDAEEVEESAEGIEEPVKKSNPMKELLASPPATKRKLFIATQRKHPRRR